MGHIKCNGRVPYSYYGFKVRYTAMSADIIHIICLDFSQGAQRTMIFSIFLNYIFFFFFVALFDSARCEGYTWPMLTANSI